MICDHGYISYLKSCGQVQINKSASRTLSSELIYKFKPRTDCKSVLDKLKAGYFSEIYYLPGVTVLLLKQKGRTKCYEVFPGVTSSYQLFPGVTSSYQVLPAVTGSFQGLPSITKCYIVLPAFFQGQEEQCNTYKQANDC